MAVPQVEVSRLPTSEAPLTMQPSATACWDMWCPDCGKNKFAKMDELWAQIGTCAMHLEDAEVKIPRCWAYMDGNA